MGKGKENGRDDEPDAVRRIDFEYSRQMNFESDEGVRFAIWNYAERLTIDRDTDEIEHFRKIAEECSVSRKFHVSDGVADLLDRFDPETLFCHVVGNPDDAVYDPRFSNGYTITVDYVKGGQKVVKGTFDRYGLPEDFPDFAAEVWNFMCFYGVSGDIFNPGVFSKILRREGESILCGVVFEEGGDVHYYLADDDSLGVGDDIVVPDGEDDHERIATVDSIEYFTEDDIPEYAVGARHILRSSTYEAGSFDDDEYDDDECGEVEDYDGGRG